ncbi:hypothetical protein BX265_8350 [Streptomyces sp. TLI_235]|nr:hypothetical protein BX265_8350 [Streptomyces sp. TLI_235]
MPGEVRTGVELVGAVAVCTLAGDLHQHELILFLPARARLGYLRCPGMPEHGTGAPGNTRTSDRPPALHAAPTDPVTSHRFGGEKIDAAPGVHAIVSPGATRISAPTSRQHPVRTPARRGLPGGPGSGGRGTGPLPGRPGTGTLSAGGRARCLEGCAGPHQQGHGAAQVAAGDGSRVPRKRSAAWSSPAASCSSAAAARIGSPRVLARYSPARAAAVRASSPVPGSSSGSAPKYASRAASWARESSPCLVHHTLTPRSCTITWREGRPPEALHSAPAGAAGLRGRPPPGIGCAAADGPDAGVRHCRTARPRGAAGGRPRVGWRGGARSNDRTPAEDTPPGGPVLPSASSALQPPDGGADGSSADRAGGALEGVDRDEAAVSADPPGRPAGLRRSTASRLHVSFLVSQRVGTAAHRRGPRGHAGKHRPRGPLFDGHSLRTYGMYLRTFNYQTRESP